MLAAGPLFLHGKDALLPAVPGVEQAFPHDLGGTARGWTISTGGPHVELTGGPCDGAKAGRFATLSFELGCRDIPHIAPDHVH